MDLVAIQAGGGGPAGVLLRPLLSVAAGGWGGVQALKAWAYHAGLRRSLRLPVPVVSVGNLAVGGTGKTPFVGWLVERLRKQGHAPGVLARGYGPRNPGGLSDEGAVLEHMLGPGLAQREDPDRVRGGRRLLGEHPELDVLVLDDGFQHRRVHRDLDLVLLDAANPFGFGRLLPRGRLRERPSALARAGAVVLTRTERLDAEGLARVRGEVRRWTAAPLALARTAALTLEGGGSRRPAAELAGRDVFAVSGLGDPTAFEDTLTRLGARVSGGRRLPDHGVLSDPQWSAILEAAQREAGRIVVVTRKDAVKCAQRHPALHVLDIATEVVEGAEALEAALARLFVEHRRAATAPAASPGPGGGVSPLP